MTQFCSNCGAIKKPLFHIRTYCPNDCDKRGNLDCGNCIIEVIGHGYDKDIYPFCGFFSNWLHTNIVKDYFYFNDKNNQALQEIEVLISMYVFDSACEFEDKYDIIDIAVVSNNDYFVNLKHDSEKRIEKILIDFVVKTCDKQYMLCFIIKPKKISIEL